MNVLMIGIGAQILTGGGGDALSRHLDYGRLAGHLTLVVSSFLHEGLGPRRFSEHLEVHPTGSRNRLAFLSDAYRLGRRICERSPVDLIVTQDPFATGLVGVLLRRRYGIPVLMGNHSSFFDNPYWIREKPVQYTLFNILGKKLIRRADGLRVVNPSEREKYIAYGVPSERIWFQPTPVPVEKFLDPPEEPSPKAVRERWQLHGKRVLLWVGDPAQKAKDLLTLLDSFAEVGRTIPEARLLLCGEFSGTPGYADEVRRRRLEEKVIFAGRIAHDELPAYYHACDLYVHVSFYEGLAKAMVEAAASGKPIVATAFPGVEAIVQDGKTGVVVPVGDPKRLALELIRLLQDPGRMEQLGVNARNDVAGRFARREMIESVVSIWRSVVERARNRG
jgi:glycosyltransferase involved in cell wall biosynthesis